MVDEALVEILTQTGRLRFAELQKLARTMPATDFARMFLFPVLVGSELYRGSLGVGDTWGSTIRFSLADLQEACDSELTDASGLRQAIYPFIHKPDTRSPIDTFTIGREGANDMVMADSIISRRHAVVTVERGRLFIRDQASSNGTRLNGRPIVPGRLEGFGAGDELTFGRFKFLVASARVLYLNLRGDEEE